jgi:Rab GDP dissociation inhibitor
MACGKLVKILLHSKVTRYLDFKSVDGSYVLKDGKVQKVPATPAEAMSSSLMGFFEKRKFRNFLMFLNAYDVKTPSTYLKGIYVLLIFHDFCCIPNHIIIFFFHFHY